MKKNTKRLLVKLSPHDTFFFGGTKTFGDRETANYFVKSEYFPQQTSLLGLVRYQLLAQCDDETIFFNNKIQDKDKAIKLIGPKGFEINALADFGKIKKLYPIFIFEKIGENAFFPANKEYHGTSSADKCLQITFSDKNPELQGYDPKKGLPNLLVTKGGYRIAYDEVFLEKQRVGIRKHYDGGTDDDAYFLQTQLAFRNKSEFEGKSRSYCFAFVLELEEPVVFEDAQVVQLGGEQKTFHMEVEEIDDDFNSFLPAYEPSNNSDKIVLVSDAFLKRDVFDYCTFGITETHDFDFIKRKVLKDQNYASRPDKNGKMELIKKGSVLYTESIENLSKNIENKTFETIGYNYFRTIKKS